jgi:hypothetical protein
LYPLKLYDFILDFTNNLTEIFFNSFNCRLVSENIGHDFNNYKVKIIAPTIPHSYSKNDGRKCQ